MSRFGCALAALCVVAPAAGSASEATPLAAPGASALSRPHFVDSAHVLRVAPHEAPRSVPAASAPPSFRIRNDALLSYGAPVSLGEGEFHYRVRVPGRRRSLVTLELLF